MASGTINARFPLYRRYFIGSESIAANDSREISYTIPGISGYKPYVTNIHIVDISNVNYAKVLFTWSQTGTTLNAHAFNTSNVALSPSPQIECIYIPG